jgi:hypothetical protein
MCFLAGRCYRFNLRARIGHPFVQFNDYRSVAEGIEKSLIDKTEFCSLYID